ncbi:hypothetical protein WMY93_026363 [Mugilogobius chulae]|uniref:DENN domain-containing protein 4B n=1 Tax=Mugilogobius chulae TaxID=88201 RepID=A0AAW0MX74_9GOBI
MTEERCPQLVDYFVVAGLDPRGPWRPLEEEGRAGGGRGWSPSRTCGDRSRARRRRSRRIHLHRENVRRSLCRTQRRNHQQPSSVPLLPARARQTAHPRPGRCCTRGRRPLKPAGFVIETTPYSRSASLSSGGPATHRVFITYRRALDCSQGLHALGVTDIALLLPAKGEVAPHTFCRVDKSLNSGMFGPALSLCYKRAVAKANALVYEANLISRLPSWRTWNSFASPGVRCRKCVCLPDGGTLTEIEEAWPLDNKLHLGLISPTLCSRRASGDRALLVRQQMGASRLLSVVDRRLCRERTLHTHISSFMHNVPFPSPQRPRILVQLSPYDNLLLCQPVSSPLPLSGASFLKLLQNLGPEHCCCLLVAALTEHKLLLHSLRPDVLTSVSEALVSMLFPLRWLCPYIPLCPLQMSDVLLAPMPFLVGVHSSYFDLHDPPPEVVCVDLDTNTIFQSEDKKPLSWKSLPRKQGKMLFSTLSQLHKTLEKICSPGQEEATLEFLLTDYDQIYRRQKQLELEIQEAFLRFMCLLLKGYRSFLLPITQAPSDTTTDCSNLFNLQGFLKSRDRAQLKFYSQLTHTQMFTQFIEECSFVSDRHACLEFFDECVQKVDVERPEEVRLVDLEESLCGEHTVFIMPPEEPQEADGRECPAPYSYETFPSLKMELFDRPQDQIKVQTKGSPAPSSPAPRRTKQAGAEVLLGARHVGQVSPGSCYGLWFIYLPTYVKAESAKVRALHAAYEALKHMETRRVVLPDEVCYRILMQLCGLYGQPVLAVRVLLEMKRAGITPNTITYGYYNKAVLESKWPSTNQGGRLLWAKLRNVLLAVAQFRQPVKRRQKSDSLGSRGESMFDSDSRPRPHSSLIRQSSWSGLSDSSSHESLPGSIVKSSSMSSMKPGDKLKLQKKALAQSTGDPRKPPLGPTAPPTGAVVPRSQVCLSKFYKETEESESESCDPPGRDSRRAVRESSVSKGVDENQNNVSSPSRGGLAGKLQQLLTPTRNRLSVRRTASVDDRKRGERDGLRRDRPSRKSQVTETLLKAKERLVNANSEVRKKRERGRRREREGRKEERERWEGEREKRERERRVTRVKGEKERERDRGRRGRERERERESQREGEEERGGRGRERPSRKSQVNETLMKAKERLVNANSEVREKEEGKEKEREGRKEEREGEKDERERERRGRDSDRAARAKERLVNANSEVREEERGKREREGEEKEQRVRGRRGRGEGRRETEPQESSHGDAAEGEREAERREEGGRVRREREEGGRERETEPQESSHRDTAEGEREAERREREGGRGEGGERERGEERERGRRERERPCYKSQVTETLLKAKERLVNANSEVREEERGKREREGRRRRQRVRGRRGRGEGRRETEPQESSEREREEEERGSERERKEAGRIERGRERERGQGEEREREREGLRRDRPSRKSQVTETLLKAKERLVNANSEVREKEEGRREREEGGERERDRARRGRGGEGKD